ncbi:MAG: pilus assembly protein PilM, partial [Raoultibacter sp.]
VDKDAALLLPNSVSLTRRLSLPMMTEAELQLNLPYEFRDYITDGKDHYYYDYAVLGSNHTVVPDPVAGLAAANEAAGDQTLDLLAVATRKDTLADYTSMCRRAGLKLRTALPYAAALQNIVSASGKNASVPAPANCCIIDFGNESTCLYFFTDGTYDVARVIDIGGRAVDEALAEALGIDEHTAVIYKQTNYEDAQANEVVLDVCENLAVEIGRALNFYDFNNPNASISTVYYSGGGALLEPLIPAVASHTDLPLVDIFEIMCPAQDDVADASVRCSGAVGATMRE